MNKIFFNFLGEHKNIYREVLKLLVWTSPLKRYILYYLSLNKTIFPIKNVFNYWLKNEDGFSKKKK